MDGGRIFNGREDKLYKWLRRRRRRNGREGEFQLDDYREGSIFRGGLDGGEVNFYIFLVGVGGEEIREPEVGGLAFVEVQGVTMVI